MGQRLVGLDPTIQGGRTRLSRWHPYPAMVADELALRLCALHVRRGMTILDPFCGTGRLLFAAARTAGVHCHGLDVNPLATLVARAKAAAPDMAILAALKREAELERAIRSEPLILRGTKVDWLSEKVAGELGSIVAFLNDAALPPDELLVAATCLSAATRDAAWIRKSGWKLHRMSEQARLRHGVSAWRCFISRLSHYLDVAPQSPLAGSVESSTADAMHLGSLFPRSPNFDLVITSPPYGDSKTTVQYGAASGICLDVVSRIDGLDVAFVKGGMIDSRCLGGKRERTKIEFTLRDFWAGAADGEPARRAADFLQDYAEVLRNCHEALRPGGSFVAIVGRRSLGGHRLRLDEFTREILVGLGCRAETSTTRALKHKNLPRKINRFGRAADIEKRLAGAVRTMDDEFILTLSKASNIAQLAA